jgi:hypothetical protein
MSAEVGPHAWRVLSWAAPSPRTGTTQSSDRAYPDLRISPNVALYEKMIHTCRRASIDGSTGGPEPAICDIAYSDSPAA